MQAEPIERARRGDHEAFGVLASASVDRLYRLARLILRDADFAQDATQDALVRAWRDLPTLRDADRFDAWLYRLLVRACTDLARRRRRWRAQVTVLSAEPIELDKAAGLADRDQLENGLRQLSDDQRAVLVLTFYADLSHAETAEALDIPIGTAKSRLHYALAALRAVLAAEDRLDAITFAKERTA